MADLRKDAEWVVRGAIQEVCPAEAVKKALTQEIFSGRIFLVAVGKAAWEMAKAAKECLTKEVHQGIVVTKYGHAKAPIDGILCLEAGHPLPDGNSFSATEEVLRLTKDLQKEDTILFFLSGGGSALFEKPLVPGEELQRITEQLLRSGADIVEINTIRKRLSEVKGGRFAKWCEPAQVRTFVLSDILGDPLDMIASGPTVADCSTCEDAMNIVEKYKLELSSQARACLETETPKEITNVQMKIIGNVHELCNAAKAKCEELGYRTVFLTDCLNCEAREAGRFLASIAKSHLHEGKLAFLAGGETVVHVKGCGLGGRNQEIALAAAKEITGEERIAVISVGSDGTDGPTDAAGGYADGLTMERLRRKGMDYEAIMENNDTYHGLEAVGGLIKTGPTGTNVNDISIVLIDGEM